MTLDDRVSRAWRRVAVMAVAGGLAIAFTFLVSTLFFLGRINSLQEQVSAGDRRSACRSRIVSAAENIRSARDTAQSRFVIATQRRGEAQRAGNADEATVQLEAASVAVAEIERHNRRLEPAMGLRDRSVEICTDDPDFTPPT